MLEFDDNKLARALSGPHSKHLTHIEQKLGVDIDSRGNLVSIDGDARERAAAILRALYARLEAGESVTLAEVDAELRFTDEARARAPGAIKTASGRAVRPRSPAQAAYFDLMRQKPLVFGIGPAGTGKTYLAAAFAAHMLHEKRVDRIILSRPALEAGERLGFLPGDLKEKIDPYLRPLYDALFDVLGDQAGRLMEQGIIEVAPLAFMRGRTLARAFVILDEAQNTTPAQMKMARTRLGETAKGRRARPRSSRRLTCGTCNLCARCCRGGDVVELTLTRCPTRPQLKLQCRKLGIPGYPLGVPAPVEHPQHGTHVRLFARPRPNPHPGVTDQRDSIRSCPSDAEEKVDTEFIVVSFGRALWVTHCSILQPTSYLNGICLRPSLCRPS